MLDETAFVGRRVCVVGNINRDLRTAPVPAGDNLFQDGETSTPFIRETLGGGAANSALAAAGLGADVRLVGKIGEDRTGYHLEAVLAAHNVRPFLVRDDEHPTGTSINLVFDNGHRHFVSSLPSSATLTYEDVDPAALQGCEHLLRADIWFSDPMLLGGNEKLFRLARDAGVAVSLDLNWDPAWGRADAPVIARRKEAVRALLPLVDLVHGNVKELCAFAGASTLDAALGRIGGWGAGEVVVHMGAQGAGFFDGRRLVREPSLPAARVVNATGTGDVLSVCMILLHRRPDVPVEEKLRLANRIVSEYVAGVRSFVPDL